MIASAMLSWMLCGLMVGLIVRLLARKRLQVGLIMTMVLAVVGAVVGGFLYSLVQGTPSESFSLSGSAWHSWIAAILGGLVVLLAWGGVYPERWWGQ